MPLTEKQKLARHHMKDWSPARKQTYLSPKQVEKLALRPMRLRITRVKDGAPFAFMHDVDVEIKLADNQWYEIVYITLSDEVATGISFTGFDQEGGGGSYPLPYFKHTYGAYTERKRLYLICNYSDG